ncbi:hypothetical protein ADK43_16810, partial [Streptomyces rimosus subsp. rimosus]
IAVIPVIPVIVLLITKFKLHVFLPLIIGSLVLVAAGVIVGKRAAGPGGADQLLGARLARASRGGLGWG